MAVRPVGRSVLLAALLTLSASLASPFQPTRRRHANARRRAAFPLGSRRREEVKSNVERTDVHVDSPKIDIGDDGGEDLPFFAGWPAWIQNGIRDSGGVRVLVNAATRTIAAPFFYRDNPWCFPEFLRISGTEYPWLVSALRLTRTIDGGKPAVSFSKEAYGDHPRQVGQVMISESVDESEDAAPLFIFLHGGAWGSGFPTMYRLLSLPFLERNFRSVILGYRTYPEADVEGQTDDLVQAVNYFVGKYGGVDGSGGPVVLMGHSSGAHVSMLAALAGRLPAVDALVAASGVYDLEKQLEQEQKMGVSEISPMRAANGFTENSLHEFSPARMVASSQYALPPDFPPVLLLHGGCDDVVPPLCSEEFYDILTNTFDAATENNIKDRAYTEIMTRQKAQSSTCNLEILDKIGHNEVVTDACIGGKAQGAILSWLDEIL